MCGEVYIPVEFSISHYRYHSMVCTYYLSYTISLHGQWRRCSGMGAHVNEKDVEGGFCEVTGYSARRTRGKVSQSEVNYYITKRGQCWCNAGHGQYPRAVSTCLSVAEDSYHRRSHRSNWPMPYFRGNPKGRYACEARRGLRGGSESAVVSLVVSPSSVTGRFRQRVPMNSE